MTTENLNEIAPDTDDLDAFTTLFNGTAKEPEAVEKEAAPTEEVEDLAPEDDTKAVEAETLEDEVVEEEKPAEQKKPKNRAQERIDELTADKRAAQREAEELRKRLEALEKQEPAKPQAQGAATPDLGTAPNPDAKTADGEDVYPLGEFDPKYIRDLTRHTIKEEQAALKAEQEREQAERAQQKARDELQDAWVDKLAAEKDKYEDFYERGVELEDTFKDLEPGYSEYLANTIKMMDKGPDVFYHLASNLDEAKRIVALGPLKATLALGRIEALYASNGKAANEALVTKAPPPPQLNKGTKGRVTVTPDTDDLDAFAKMFFK